MSDHAYVQLVLETLESRRTVRYGNTLAQILNMLLLCLMTVVVQGTVHLDPSATNFKKGAGGHGLCGDLDPGPGGLGNVT